jgi:hypothetical protein
MTSDEKLREMVRGYWLGRVSGFAALPDCHALASPAFKHGWLNGRDDRLGLPRERASVLIARADMIIGDPARRAA